VKDRENFGEKSFCEMSDFDEILQLKVPVVPYSTHVSVLNTDSGCCAHNTTTGQH